MKNKSCSAPVYIGSQSHKLALIHLFLVAHDKIIAMDLVTFRKRIKERKSRENEFLRDIYYKEISKVWNADGVCKIFPSFDSMDST